MQPWRAHLVRRVSGAAVRVASRVCGRRALLASVALLTLAAPGTRAAEPRVALVIGNAAYANAPLTNPVNDAQMMSDVLSRLGFRVIARRDGDQTTMKRAIQEFGAQLESAGPDAVGLFYYAGHGVQLNGRNYLIPTRAHIEREADVEIEGVSTDWVLEQMRYARNRLNIVILDACRNNPFARSMRSADRGLAKMDAPAGVLIAYSTAPGEVAADGDGLNSPYTAALVQAMRESRQPVEQVFKRARIAVRAATAGHQTPWESSSLTGDFYFLGDAAPPSSVAAPAPLPAQKLPPPETLPPRVASVPRTAPDDVCMQLVGRWRAAGVEGEIAIQPDHTLEWWRRTGDRMPSVTGDWSCQSPQARRFMFVWANGFIDTITLAADGRALNGANQLRLPVVLTRLR